MITVTSDNFYPDFDEIILSGYVAHFKRDSLKMIIYCKHRQSDNHTFAVKVPTTASAYFEDAAPSVGDYLKVRATSAVWACGTTIFDVFSNDDILEHKRLTTLKDTGG